MTQILAAHASCRPCRDCQRSFPVDGLYVHACGLLCQDCHDEEQALPKLREGDRVLWKSSFGSGAPSEAKVTVITRTDGVWPDDGEDVQRVNWIECRDRGVAVTLDNGKWAWGFQLAPWVNEAEQARQMRDHHAAVQEEVFTEGRVHRQPDRINPHD